MMRRKIKRGIGADDFAAAVHAGDEGPRRAAVQRAQFGHVRPADEGLAGSGQHYRTGVGRQSLEGGDEGGHHLRREGVQLLRPVDGDRGDQAGVDGDVDESGHAPS